MKWFWNPCRRHRKSLCLLASGLLPEPERAGIENHLATCAECRSYFDQIKTMTVPLADWERHFAHIDADIAVQLRLAKAITSAGRSKSVRRLTPVMILFECWRQLIWPCRRIWAGLAVVWVLLLAVNILMEPRSPAALAKNSPSMDVIVTWQQQAQLLAELIGPNEPRAGLLPKPFSPQPSSERRFETMAT